MPEDETVSGYRNVETFQFISTYQNVEWLNDRLIDVATAAVIEDQEISDHDLGDRLVAWAQVALRKVMASSDTWQDHPLWMLDRAVGSWWRIDRVAVGESIREDVVEALR